MHLDASRADHTRLRKTIAPAFNDNSLLKQEHLIRRHIDLLLSSLHSAVDGPSNGRLDISAAFNFAAFDIIGYALGAFPCGSRMNVF